MRRKLEDLPPEKLRRMIADTFAALGENDTVADLRRALELAESREARRLEKRRDGRRGATR